LHKVYIMLYFLACSFCLLGFCLYEEVRQMLRGFKPLPRDPTICLCRNHHDIHLGPADVAFQCASGLCGCHCFECPQCHLPIVRSRMSEHRQYYCRGVSQAHIPDVSTVGLVAVFELR